MSLYNISPDPLPLADFPVRVTFHLTDGVIKQQHHTDEGAQALLERLTDKSQWLQVDAHNRASRINKQHILFVDVDYPQGAEQ